ncbi:MAG: DUF3341 domain-containing protein [Sandaracinaceae bacterium]
MAHANAVIGFVDSQSRAETVVSELQRAGFSLGDISVLFGNKGATRDFALEKHTKAPEGASIGGIAGGAVGGVLGLLAGIGTIVIPGLGALVAAGPIIAALSGAGAGAAAGGLIGGLTGMGFSEVQVKTYESRLKSGEVLLAVHTESSEDRNRAKAVLERANAADIATVGEKRVEESEVRAH